MSLCRRVAPPFLDLFLIDLRPSRLTNQEIDPHSQPSHFYPRPAPSSRCPRRPVLEAAPRRIAGAPKNLVEAPFTSSQALSAGRTPPQMSASNRSAAEKVGFTKRLHMTTVTVRLTGGPAAPQRLAQAADIGVFSSNINFQEERTSPC